jgi:hypothetical protein
MLQEIEKIREFHFVKKCKLGNEGCLDFYDLSLIGERTCHESRDWIRPGFCST